MKFSVTREAWDKVSADLLAVGVSDNAIAKGSLAEHIDTYLDGAISRILKQEEFKTKPGATRLLSTLGALPAPYVLVMGLGERKSFSLETLRKAGAAVASHAKTLNAKKVAAEIFATPRLTRDLSDRVQALAEGVLLSSYDFSAYKSEKKPLALQEVSLLASTLFSSKRATIEKALHSAQVLCEACNSARDLVNTPPQDMAPAALAAAAKKVKGVHVKVLHKAEIEALKMGSFLSVARGSGEPPVFIEMSYMPTKRAKKILAVVGKGVTFDSGGLSLKPAKSMETMKCDMAGAASVIAFMKVVSELKPAIEIRAYVAATENMPDGVSTRPGDVVRAMNGKTIEVLNTDAEGRLTLVDALHYALTRKTKPDYVIDMATLTGACLVALGERCTAAMGTDQALIDKLKKAGDKTGEMVWQLPLIEEYLEDLKSSTADIQNSGGRYAGSIIGGLFLKEFIGDAKWVHLDIAGSAWTDKPLPYNPKGGTGVMVRTLWEFVQMLS